MRSGSRRRNDRPARTYRSHSPIGRMTGRLPKPPRVDPVGEDGKVKKFGMRVTDEDRVLAARNVPMIISCSRRTDVPWAFLRQYLKGFEEGFIYVASGARKGAVGGQCVANARAVCVRPWTQETRKGVVCISWWSKNFQKWIAEYQKPDSVLHRYPVHIFNFTINSDNLDIEPGMQTLLPERLAQATYLAKTFGPHALNCRFDPIVFYRKRGGPVVNNLKDFKTVMEHLGNLGIDHITFSFCQAYPKSVRNMRDAGLELVVLNKDQEHAVLDELMPIAHKHGIQMRCCGNKGLVGYPLVKNSDDASLLVEKRTRLAQSPDSLPIVGQSRCVDAQLADRIAREKGLPIFLNPTKDLAQREACECHRSTDIGQYSFACPHACRYCYANPMKKAQACADDQPQQSQASAMQLTPGPNAQSALGAAIPPPSLLLPGGSDGQQAPSPALVTKPGHIELLPFSASAFGEAANPMPAYPGGGGAPVPMSLMGMPTAGDAAGLQPPLPATSDPSSSYTANDLLQRIYGGGFNYLNLMSQQQPQPPQQQQQQQQ